MRARSEPRTTIIAEIGSNHNGSLDTAFELIDMAAQCGADVCKFQSFLADHLLADADPNYARLKRLELPRAWYPQLMDHCAKRGVGFLSTATNFTTLEWMEELGVDGYKVASCNITYRPLLDRLIAIGKPIIISTGMSTLDEVMAASRLFSDGGMEQVAFLHCIAKYPAKAHEMHLGNITVLRQVLPYTIGLSDHSEGAHIPAAAVALGARVVEKHISLDKQGLGLDHEVAVLPATFAEMCRVIRDVEAALPMDFTPDRDTIFRMRRSLRFVGPLPAGAIVGEADLKVTRPEDGLLPDVLPQVLGRRLAAAVAANQPLHWELLEGGAP